jgi:hypothetical protein
MTQDFLPRFTCFPAIYSSLWRCTHLTDRELIDYQELNPQRVPHIHSHDGDPPSHDHSVRSLFFSENHTGLTPLFLRLRRSRKKTFHFHKKRRNLPRKLGGRERGTQTPLYRSNSTVFANVLTPPSVYHNVHMC